MFDEDEYMGDLVYDVVANRIYDTRAKHFVPRGSLNVLLGAKLLSASKVKSVFNIIVRDRLIPFVNTR